MKIIQDSEDEDELDFEEPEGAVLHGNAPPNPISSNVSVRLGEKGTGSTESLKRAIVAAHRAQFRDESPDRQVQSNPSEAPSAPHRFAPNNFQDALQPSVSLPEHASKRRRTSLDAAIALASSRDIIPTSLDPHHTEQAVSNTNTHLGTIPDKAWDFQGTMQDDWEHHEPMGLFAQTVSSTIPNATATQEQLLAEVLAPEFLNIEPEPDPDAPKYEPAKSSVPWSEYLKSSARGSDVVPQSAEQLPPPSDDNNTCQLMSPSIGSSLLPEVALEPSDSIVDALCPPIVERVSKLEGTAGEAQLHSSIRHITTSRSSNMTLKLGSVPETEDDLSAIGSLLEQYKPRPSRSRSLRLSMDEPIDYSKRPERIAKKTRRTRTSGEVETTSTATTPEKVRQICDMGFTPLTTKKALRQHNGDVTHTVDWLIATGIPAEDEPKSSETNSRRKSKRDDAIQDLAANMNEGKITEPPIEMPDTAMDTNTAGIAEDFPEPVPKALFVKSPTVVKVVIPGTNKRITPDNSSKQSTAPAAPRLVSVDTSAEPTSEVEVFDRLNVQLEEEATAAQQPPKGKKRGRGRPRKEVKTTVSIAEELQVETSKPDNIAAIEDAQVEDKTHKPEEPEELVATESTLDEHRVRDADDANLGSKIDHTTPEPPPLGKKIKQTNEATSSIGKGKTPYRVGLSKRARIAPLLRIVKK